MPLVSLPAAPASRRKFVLNAAYLAGNSLSSSRSSVWIPASATSEVPVRYRLSRSRWYRLDSSVGRNPVPYMARSPTSTGGRTVMNPFPARRSRTKRYRAISVTATSPKRYANRDPDSRAPRAMSIQPAGPPRSVASRTPNVNRGGSPQVRSTTESSSAMPSAALGSGRLGIRASRACRLCSASARSDSAASSSLRRCRRSASSPGLGLPPRDDRFCAARRFSARSVSSRQVWSAASRASKSSAAPRRASADR